MRRPDEAAEKTPLIPSLVVSGFCSFATVTDKAMLMGTKTTIEATYAQNALVVRSFISSALIRFLIATPPGWR